jgi:hypothetical protein
MHHPVITIGVTTIADTAPSILHTLTGPQPRWMQQAACADIGPTFADADTGGDETAAAKHCIDACTVRAQCLAYALHHEVKTNTGEMIVWGGLTPLDLRRLHRLLLPDEDQPHDWRSHAASRDDDRLAGSAAANIEARLGDALGCLVRDRPDSIPIANLVAAINALANTGQPAEPAAQPARPQKTKPTAGPKCGSHAGYHAHQSRGERACGPCAAARADWQRQHRAAKRATPCLATATP